jgi:hypothetical protein
LCEVDGCDVAAGAIVGEKMLCFEHAREAIVALRGGERQISPDNPING